MPVTIPCLDGAVSGESGEPIGYAGPSCPLAKPTKRRVPCSSPRHLTSVSTVGVAIVTDKSWGITANSDYVHGSVIEAGTTYATTPGQLDVPLPRGASVEVAELAP
jgi:hypothetical protein